MRMGEPVRMHKVEAFDNTHHKKSSKVEIRCNGNLSLGSLGDGTTISVATQVLGKRVQTRRI